MIPISSGVRVWIASGHCDMRNYAATMVMRSCHRRSMDYVVFTDA